MSGAFGSRRLTVPLILSSLAVTLTILACSVGGATGATSGVAGAPTSPTGCATVPGFAQVTSTPSAGAHFTDIGYPVGAVGYTSASSAPEPNGFQHHRLHVCVPNSTADAIRPFYTTNLAGHGWTTTATFPSSGDLSSLCPHTPDCYIKNDGVIRFVSVEDVTSSGSMALYTLHLVIQPYAMGSAALNSGDRMDFDPTGPGGGTDDVTWIGSQMTPVGTAKLASVGPLGSLDALSYTDVAGAHFTTTPLAASTLVPGYTFDVATSDGHYTKVRVTSHTGAQLQIEYVTFAYTF